MVKKKTKQTNVNKIKRNRYIKKGIIGLILFISIAVVAVGINIVYDIIGETEEFNPEVLMRYEPFTILDADDNEIYSYGAEPVEFEDIPEVMVDAIVAIEDSRFYEHNGFDIPRIIKAVLGNFTSGSIQSGASTITQQVIKKNYYPEAERTYTRKIGEVFLAIQADAQMDKNTILTCYLNTIDYGVGINVKGIKAAAKYYFNKSVSELTLPEAAYLAGVVNAPSAYDAYYNLDYASKRRNTVLDLMEMHGYITAEECKLAKSTKLENQLAGRNKNSLGYERYQSYIDAVVEEAINILYKDIYTQEEITDKKADLTKEVLDSPITIHTFMNAELQEYLEEDVAKGNASGVYYSSDDMEVAGSIQDNYTGRIVGLLGGRDYVDYTLNDQLTNYKAFGFNRATTGKVSPGSSLKPLVAYLPGIEFLDWPTFATITDSEGFKENGNPVVNWDGRFHGAQSFSKALANSWNVTAVKALDYTVNQVGRQKVIDLLNGMGLTVNDYDPNNNDPYDDFHARYAIGAWSEGVTMVQEAGAYATLANGGTYYKPHTIDYIQYNNNNDVIEVDKEITDNGTQAITPETAFMVRELMKDYTPGNYSYISQAAYATGISIGAKSGTSTNLDDDTNGYVCAVFTPDYAISFWTGEDNKNATIDYSNQNTPFGASAGCIRILHSDGTNHSYPSRPSGVYQATAEIGTEPWEKIYSASEYTPKEYKVSGYYKAGGITVSGARTPEIKPLASFTATSENDKAIAVTFTPYPDEKLINIDKAYLEGKKLNRDYMYGRILYSVILRNKTTGEELLKQTSETPTFSIPYDLTEEIEVCGRYEFSNQEKLFSEEKTVSLAPVKVNLPDITFNISANGSSIINGTTTSHTAAINVTASIPTNTITISVSGPSYKNTKSYKGDCALALTNLKVGTYTVTITEQDEKKTNSVTATAQFKVEENQPTPPPTTPDSSETQNENSQSDANNN